MVDIKADKGTVIIRELRGTLIDTIADTHIIIKGIYDSMKRHGDNLSTVFYKTAMMDPDLMAEIFELEDESGDRSDDEIRKMVMQAFNDIGGKDAAD